MEDTIAAISTALGEGGIGIVRVSGPSAIAIADSVFKGSKIKSLLEAKSHRIYYGWIQTLKKQIVDEVLVSVMHSPNTYTREDIIEINCHGGLKPLENILHLLLEQGARLAEPGEFTKRAFLNGRIDLTQAEAVIDIIRSKTDRSLQVSVDQLKGNLSLIIEELRAYLLQIRARIEISIDYPEHDEPEATKKDIKDALQKVQEKVVGLISSSRSGRILREGLKTVIVGKPNVGKSSLLNALLGVDRAIVTDVPGTTRDTVEEMLSLGGMPLHIIDTAGIRESDDPVERMGIKKSQQALAEADLVLFVLDASENIDQVDKGIAEQLNKDKAVAVLNKMDIDSNAVQKDDIKELGFDKVVEISALQRSGLSELEEQVRELFMSGQVSSGSDIVVTNIRHVNLLKKTKQYLDSASKALEQNIPVDIIAIDVDSAWENLGLIIGQAVSEDLVDHIFAEFCLGK